MKRQKVPAAIDCSDIGIRLVVWLFAAAIALWGCVAVIGCAADTFQKAVRMAPEVMEHLEPAEELADELGPGDNAVTAKETLRWVNDDTAHLWLSLDDRRSEPEPWSKEFDSYKQKLMESGRILRIPAGTSVTILSTSSTGTDDMDIYYLVEILEGEYSGRKGWLSRFGLSKR